MCSRGLGMVLIGRCFFSPKNWSQMCIKKFWKLVAVPSISWEFWEKTCIVFFALKISQRKKVLVNLTLCLVLLYMGQFKLNPWITMQNKSFQWAYTSGWGWIAWRCLHDVLWLSQYLPEPFSLLPDFLVMLRHNNFFLSNPLQSPMCHLFLI